MKMHRDARSFEDRIAADLGGRRVPMSGAGHEKADIRSQQAVRLVQGVPELQDGLQYRVEAKTTGAANYTFKLQDWIDLTRSADRAGEQPIFAISFVRSRTLHQDFVIIRRSFAELIGVEAAGPEIRINRHKTLYGDDLLVNRSPRPVELIGVDRCVLIHYDHFLYRLGEHGLAGT
jgi:hypothetical protein